MLVAIKTMNAKNISSRLLTKSETGRHVSWRNRGEAKLEN